jgi:hypothetical protein
MPVFSEMEETQKNKSMKRGRTRSYQIRQTGYKKTIEQREEKDKTNE